MRYVVFLLLPSFEIPFFLFLMIAFYFRLVSFSSGHTVQFCRDQHGSRFIQQKLEVSSDEDKEAFFEEILPHTQR